MSTSKPDKCARILCVDNDEKIREAILRHMAAQGLRQAELARRLEVTPQSLHQVLRGQKARLPTSLTAVLDALDLELVVQRRTK